MEGAPEEEVPNAEVSEFNAAALGSENAPVPTAPPNENPERGTDAEDGCFAASETIRGFVSVPDEEEEEVFSEALFPVADGILVAEFPNEGGTLSLDPKVRPEELLAEEAEPKEKPPGALSSFGMLTAVVESGKEKPEEVMEAAPELFFSSSPFSAPPNVGKAGRAEREEDCEVLGG